MKLPPFDHSKNARKYDRFGEFYNELENRHYWGYNANPFIMLETGEFFISRGRFPPDKRHTYEGLNISIMGSADPLFAHLMNGKKLLTPDGDEVKRSWLNQETYQTLIIDHDTNHVVRSSWPNNSDFDKADTRIPPRLRKYASVYWAGEGEPPMGRKPLSLSAPHPKDDEAVAHVDSLVAACKAWNALADEAQEARTDTWAAHKPDGSTGKYIPNPYYIGVGPFVFNELLKMSFDTMTWGEKKRLALRGYWPRRLETEVTYLIIQ